MMTEGWELQRLPESSMLLKMMLDEQQHKAARRGEVMKCEDDVEEEVEQRPEPPPQKRKQMFYCKAEGCGKVLSTRLGLKEHERLHSGALPYECRVKGCGRRFKWRSSASIHRKSHKNREELSRSYREGRDNASNATDVQRGGSSGEMVKGGVVHDYSHPSTRVLQDDSGPSSTSQFAKKDSAATGMESMTSSLAESPSYDSDLLRQEILWPQFTSKSGLENVFELVWDNSEMSADSFDFQL